MRWIVMLLALVVVGCVPPKDPMKGVDEVVVTVRPHAYRGAVENVTKMAMEEAPGFCVDSYKVVWQDGNEILYEVKMKRCPR